MIPRAVGVATCWAATLSLVCGCANNPFRTAPPAAPSLEPPLGVAAPAHTLPVPSPARPSYADVDGRQLQAALSRSRQETDVMQDEITALRDQLASTSSQLARLRSGSMAAAGTAPPPAGMVDAVAPPSSPAAMQAAVAQLAIPGVDARVDGAVARIDVAAERLFEPGTAALVPGGAAILTQVAGELERVFPGHFIGIEGHLDTEPLQNASWGSAHQLTAARSAAVFDFLTARTRMHEGQLFIVAHGANHPLVSNATAAGRSRNRRMELVVYPERAAAQR